MDPHPPSPPSDARPEPARAAASARPRHAELILETLDELPTLPSVASRLMSASSADDADLNDIVRLIESDPALSARVLSLCARAELGVSHQITTVHHAVVMLGLHAVQSACLAVKVFDTLCEHTREHADARAASGRGDSIEPFDAIGFWEHSIAVAVASERLASAPRAHRGPSASVAIKPEIAFIAGLLHDLGKLALHLVLPQAYARVAAANDGALGNIAHAERRILGIDHHAAGKRLAEHWKLPEFLVHAIWLHNLPPHARPQNEHSQLVTLVGLADAVARSLHLGWSGNYEHVGSLEEIAARSHGLVDAEAIREIMPRIHEAHRARCKDLGLDQQPSQDAYLSSILRANQSLERLRATARARSADATRHADTLAAIADFQTQAARATSMTEILTGIVRSARSAMRSSPRAAIPAILVVLDARDTWMLARFDASGLLLGADACAPPASASTPVSESAAASGPENTPIGAERNTPAPPRRSGLADVRGAKIPAWLRDWLGARGVQATTELHAIDLTPGGEPISLLLCDAPTAASWAATRDAAALIATWGFAIASVVQRDQGRRLGEQLADASRAMTEMQGQLTEAQSLARLAQLTAGAAHEMNSPLTVISGRAQSILSRTQDSSVRAEAAALVDASARLSSLLTRLHTIANPPALKRTPVSMTDLIAKAVQLSGERTLSRGKSAALPRIRLSIPDPLPPASIDRDLLLQAVVEVLNNAIEAHPRGFVEIRVYTEPQEDHLVVQITDDGDGMSPVTARHAFDPFYSNKPAGRQPGLGLALAHRVVTLHHGSIRIKSRINEGTTVTITLPNWRATPHAAPLSTPTGRPHPSASGFTDPSLSPAATTFRAA